MKHTIFALASAPGRAGVAVIRLSGPSALETVRGLAGKSPPARTATYTALHHEGVLIDRALVLTFPAPASFTGEDCAELQVHGSRAVLDQLYRVLTAMGLRLAEPGEFSRRALENGKMDLTQAEAVADLVDAETEAQRQQALTQLDGGLSHQYDRWRSDLIDLLARLEVYIDFPDEDLPTSLVDDIVARMRAVESDLSLAIADSERGQQIREGLRIAILGEPNAGKSSLFNALLQSDAAIVTPVAGTTRDVLEAQLRLGAYYVRLHDTAGLRETEDVVESEGIRRARRVAQQAHMRLWVLDASHPSPPEADLFGPNDVVVFNKTDMATPRPELSQGRRSFDISVTESRGIDALMTWLEADVASRLSGQTFPAATRQRHLDRLSAARDELRTALQHSLAVPELTAEHVRAAINAFEALFGRYDVEGVLDVVFGNFCIGK